MFEVGLSSVPSLPHSKEAFDLRYQASARLADSNLSLSWPLRDI